MKRIGRFASLLLVFALVLASVGTAFCAEDNSTADIDPKSSFAICPQCGATAYTDTYWGEWIQTDLEHDDPEHGFHIDPGMIRAFYQVLVCSCGYSSTTPLRTETQRYCIYG